MRIETLAPGAYALTSSIQLAPGFILPLRSTALCRTDGGVVLVGPTSFDARAIDFIDELGPVRALVAPNRLHYLSLAAASARWPNARVYLAPGLASKLAGVRADETLSETATQLGPDLTLVGIDGAPALGELAVFHRPSQTLVVTDLVFNVTAPMGWLTPLVLRAVGVHRRLAQGRELRLLVKDRAAAAASARRLLALPFERLVMAHGEVVGTDARGQLEAALAWMLAAAPR
jgi:hypothetical protein